MLTHLRRRGLRRQAQAMASRQSWEAAVTSYRRLAALGQMRAADHVRLARALDELGDKTGAEAAYRRATAEFPTAYNTHRQLGLFLWGGARSSLAVSAFLRAFALEPSEDVLEHDVRRSGAPPRRIIEMTLEAFLATETPVGVQCRDAWKARRQRKAARAAFRARDWPKAIALGRRLVDTGSPASADQLRLALALKEAGDLPASLTAHWRALATSPRDPEMYLHLGHCLKMLGRTESATHAYLVAWRLQPGQRDVERELLGQGWSRSALELLTNNNVADGGRSVGSEALQGASGVMGPEYSPTVRAIMGDLVLSMTRNG